MNLNEACSNILAHKSNCTEDVMSTYEVLRSESQKTSPHCVNRTEKLFCDVLRECNKSYVRGLVCQEVQQEYCTSEWRRAENNRSYSLIDCDKYGETATLNCSDQFGLDENGLVCSPLCKDFPQNGEEAITVLIAATVIAHLMNVIGGVIVLIAACKNRKNMRVKQVNIHYRFRYPQVLLSINTIMITILCEFLKQMSCTVYSFVL